MKISKLLVAQLDELGREINNPVPHFVPVGSYPLSIQDQIRRLLRQELSQQARDQGYESFDESDDFDVDDVDDAPETEYQSTKMMPDWPNPADNPKGKKDAAARIAAEPLDDEELPLAEEQSEKTPKEVPDPNKGVKGPKSKK